MRRHLTLIPILTILWTLTGTVFGQNATPQRVLVIPFTTLNVPESHQWISRAVQENLVTDLGRSGRYTPIAFRGQVVVEDNIAAARLARNASTALVVRGAIQFAGEEVRLTGQLIDARTGATLNTASTTGLPADLLRLQDDLAAQLRGVRTTAAASADISAAPGPGASAPAIPPATTVVVQTPAPQVIVITPPSQPSYAPYYPSGYPLGYYSSPPVLYSHIIIRRSGPHHGRGSRGPQGALRQVQLPTGNNPSHGFLPIPNSGVLPIPTHNILPLPNNSVLPLPRNTILPNPQSRVTPLAPAARLHATVSPSPAGLWPQVG